MNCWAYIDISRKKISHRKELKKCINTFGIYKLGRTMNHGYESAQNIFLPKNTVNRGYKSVQFFLPDNLL